MEAKEISSLIGSEVWWADGNAMADIVSYEKGWVTIKTDDGEEHKARAKAITLMDSEDDLVETNEGLEVVEAEDPSEDSSAPDSVAEGEIECSCGTTFKPPKLESFRCPACGAWHHVRLHPDLDKYVKGLDATPSGRDTLDINDGVATDLRGMDIDNVYIATCDSLLELHEKARFSKAMAKDFTASGDSCERFLRDRYGKLNPGMQRMNLGNLLRGAIKRNMAIENAKMIDARNSEKVDK